MIIIKIGVGENWEGIDMFMALMVVMISRVQLFTCQSYLKKCFLKYAYIFSHTY